MVLPRRGHQHVAEGMRHHEFPPRQGVHRCGKVGRRRERMLDVSLVVGRDDVAGKRHLPVVPMPRHSREHRLHARPPQALEDRTRPDPGLALVDVVAVEEHEMRAVALAVGTPKRAVVPLWRERVHASAAGDLPDVSPAVHAVDVAETHGRRVRIHLLAADLDNKLHRIRERPVGCFQQDKARRRPAYTDFRQDFSILVHMHLMVPCCPFFSSCVWGQGYVLDQILNLCHSRLD